MNPVLIDVAWADSGAGLAPVGLLGLSRALRKTRFTRQEVLELPRTLVEAGYCADSGLYLVVETARKLVHLSIGLELHCNLESGRVEIHLNNKDKWYRLLIIPEQRDYLFDYLPHALRDAIYRLVSYVVFTPKEQAHG